MSRTTLKRCGPCLTISPKSESACKRRETEFSQACRLAPNSRGVEMDIQDMRIFARVAAVQNLSAVGTELGLTPGTISKRIQALEDELHARLFDRTTRSIRITEEGSTFLLHVERILSEIEAARASVDDKVTKPKGKLKLAAPACLGRRYIAPALCEFMRAFPEIEVQVDLKDRQVNLQEEGYDVAIRTGALSDSSLIAKRLAPDRAVIVASPSYVARMGRPMRPEDLARHDCLVLGDRWQWSFGKNGAETSVRVKGPLRSNNGEMLTALGYPQDFVHAVLAHGWEYSGVKPETLCEKTLYTVDELTGFITAVALVRPSKSLMDLEVKSVKKKWKDKGFARAVNRDVIERGSELMGEPLEVLIERTIESLKPIEKELGLGE